MMEESKKKLNDLLEQLEPGITARTKWDVQEPQNAIVEINDFVIHHDIIINKGEKNEIKIEPICLEAYYYHKDSKNKDGNPCHDAKRAEDDAHPQRDRPFKLYFHESGRGGVDLVLSYSEDYAFSLLIKEAKINDDRIAYKGPLKQLGIFYILCCLLGLDPSDRDNANQSGIGFELELSETRSSKKPIFGKRELPKDGKTIGKEEREAPYKVTLKRN